MTKRRRQSAKDKVLKTTWIGLCVVLAGTLLLVMSSSFVGNFVGNLVELGPHSSERRAVQNQSATTNQQTAVGNQAIESLANGRTDDNSVLGQPPISPANPRASATITNADAVVAELNAKGNNLLKAGEVEGAIQAYRQALALTPNDEDLHYNLGLAYARRGDLTNAEVAYREALRLLPDFPEVRNNLGKLLLREGKQAEAEAEFKEAIELMPEYAQAHNNLGILYQQQQRPQEALHSFRKAVQCDTNYLEAHFNLAGVYFQARNVPMAIAELRETVRINPGFKPAQRLLEQLTNSPAVSAGTNQ